MSDAAEPREPQSAGMNDQQLAEAKRYGRLGLCCLLCDRGLDAAYLSAASLAAAPLDDWLRSFAWLDAIWTLRLAVFFLIFTAVHVLVSLPLSCYSGHVLERRFALSTQSFAGWLWRYAKRMLLTAAFGLAMTVGLFWLIWTVGPWWWLAAAAAFFAVSVVLGQLFPVLILPLFYRVERLDAPELTERLARLAAGTGLTIAGVYRLDLSAETIKANAMLAGLGRTRRVLLGDTLLARFAPEEIEVIFAHEIGHHVLRHVPKLIAGGLAFSLAGFWLCDRLLGLGVGGFAGDYAQLPVHALPWLSLVLTLFGWLLEPLQNGLSRRFERQADRYALARTGDAAAYAAAFQKLAVLNKDDPAPHPLEVWLFHSHPPIGERLALGRAVATGANDVG